MIFISDYLRAIIHTTKKFHLFFWEKIFFYDFLVYFKDIIAENLYLKICPGTEFVPESPDF